MKVEEWIGRLKDRLGEWPFRGPEPPALDASVDPTVTDSVDSGEFGDSGEDDTPRERGT